MSKISIVIPVYYNADTLMLLYEDMKAKILGVLGDYELVFVDDGSGDNSWEIMKLLEQINERGTTVLVVTHNKEIVNAMKKRVVTMHDGVIISDEKEGGYHEA
mgnify:CR=1 FL=1